MCNVTVFFLDFFSLWFLIIFGNLNLQEPLSKAQKNKNYIEKLKRTQKFDDFKKKRSAAQRDRRRAKKIAESEMPKVDLDNAIAKRREEIRERVKRHRERSEAEKTAPNVLDSDSVGTDAVKKIIKTTYKSRQTLGKAVRKVTRAFPASPTKKKAVLAQIVDSMDDNARNEIIEFISPSQIRKKRQEHSLIKEIKQFLARDDISRVSPKTKDVKQYVNSETGDMTLIPKRHMTLTVKEAYAVFAEEQKFSGKGVYIECLPHFHCFCLNTTLCHSFIFRLFQLLIFCETAA